MWFSLRDSILYIFCNLLLYLRGYITDVHSKYYTCLYIRQLSCQENILLLFLLLALHLFLQIALIQKSVTLANLWRTINTQASVPKSLFLLTCQKKDQSHNMHVSIGKKKRESADLNLSILRKERRPRETEIKYIERLSSEMFLSLVKLVWEPRNQRT